MADLSEEILVARTRSETYRSLSHAFRRPSEEASVRLGLPTPSSETRAEFLAAFDPAISKSACSLYESAYVTEARHALFEDLIRFYRYFGLQRDSHAELPDHLSIELEFMHFLTFLEHTALCKDGDKDGLRRAQRDFLSRHVLRLSRGITATCKTEDQWCLALVETLRAFVGTELQSRLT